MSMTRFQNEDTATQLVDLKQTQARLENELNDDKGAAPAAKKGVAVGASNFLESILQLFEENVPQAQNNSAPQQQQTTSSWTSVKTSRAKGSKRAKEPVQSSFFVTDAISKATEMHSARAKGVSMMPAKTADQKLIAKMTGRTSSLDYGSVKLAEMSIRGSSLTGADAKPVSGLKVVHKNASLESAGNTEVRQALMLVIKTQKDPMSYNRTEDGLGKGNADAEQAVKQLGNSETATRLKEKARLAS